jgi:four helix bundle protein
MNEASKPPDLGDRLLAYATGIVRLSESLGKTFARQHIARQILRSGTAPMAHHAEAQSAESNPDFVHKLKIALKELRETHRWLKLIQEVPLIENPKSLDSLIDETDQLERILNASITTVKSRHNK